MLYDADEAASQENIKRANNKAHDITVSKAFGKPVGTEIGTKVYTITDSPQQILMGPNMVQQHQYGQGEEWY